MVGACWQSSAWLPSASFNYQKLPIDAVPDITNVRYRSIPRRQDIHRWRPSNG